AWGTNVTDHVGIIDIAGPSGNGNSFFQLAHPIAESFTTFTKAVARFVLAKSGSYTSSSAKGEFFLGFADSATNTQNGALFSYAPGYTNLPAVGGGTVTGAAGLLAGTYKGAA